MAFEENDVYAALGMEVPAKQPEAADPAASQGENDPSLAGTDGREENAGEEAPSEEPKAESETTGQEETTEKPDAKENGASSPAQPMSRAERAEQARLRRERETQAAVDAAVQAALRSEREKNEAEMKAMFAAAGMVDRYHDNKPITTLEEFNAFQAARQADKLGRELQSGKLTPESFQAAVDNSPAVKAAQAAVERLTAREEAERESARKAEFERKMAEELAEINRMDPNVKTLEDAMALPTGGEFVRLVRDNGLTFLQAFKLANADSLAEARARAAREGAARNAAGKSHLRSITSPAGGVLADVPAETRRIYKDLFPDMTDEQIRKDYAKRMK